MDPHAHDKLTCYLDGGGPNGVSASLVYQPKHKPIVRFSHLTQIIGIPFIDLTI